MKCISSDLVRLRSVFYQSISLSSLSVNKENKCCPWRLSIQLFRRHLLKPKASDTWEHQKAVWILSGKLVLFLPSGLLYLNSFDRTPVFNENIVGPDQMPSDLPLRCLPVSLLWDARHKMAELFCLRCSSIYLTRTHHEKPPI